VGCGIGGPARFFAERGCRVTGVDLTEEFVQVAQRLTRMIKLDGKAEFRQGSALALPFTAGEFDGAYMIHVGMNIADKAGVFREVARVVKPGGQFAIFDIMRSGEAAIEFPVPWAAAAETSFLASVEDYERALEEAGFRVVHRRERTQFAVEFLQKMMSRSAPPILGVHVLMGEKAPLMLKNVMAATLSGATVPVELVGRKN